MVVGGVPALVAQLPGHTNRVNKVVLVPNDTALITVSDDRTIRVWIKRSTGEYWPSICQTLEWCVSSLALDNFHLFVGLESGAVNHYKLTEDLNRITLLRILNVHQMRVTDLIYSAQKDWLLSAGKDKAFHWYTAESGRRMGSYVSGASCTCLALDEPSSFAFVGDYGGAIHMIRLGEEARFGLVSTLAGHSGSIRALHWEGEKGRLVSCSADKTVFVWEIGEGKGTALQLHGHRDRVNAIVYSGPDMIMMSFGADKKMCVWNMRTERHQAALWEESNECQECGGPFFWNLGRLWEERAVTFKRQHHCRRCGRAVCGECSPATSILPYYGFELPVRVCKPCYQQIPEDELCSSTATHSILIDQTCVHLDRGKKLLAVAGTDNVIRLYDVAACL